VLVAVPGETLDADLRDVAAEAAVTIDESGARAGAGRRKRRRKTPRTSTSVSRTMSTERAGSTILLVMRATCRKERDCYS
jgi:hypothetical protein